MELAHALGRLDVNGVLLLVGRGYVPGDKAENPDLIRHGAPFSVLPYRNA